MKHPAVVLWSVLLGAGLLALLSSPAEAESCGGKNERACCVGERTAGACDAGLHEEVGCKGNCKCKGSSFSSSGTCRANKPISLPGLPTLPKAAACGKAGERACCLGERAQGACDNGLREATGCKGNCQCGNLPAQSSGTCTPPTPCGKQGERACCVGERKGTSCDSGLIEIPGCKGDCQCRNSALASSGTCDAPLPALITLTHEAELEKMFGAPTIKRLKTALAKTIADPRNTPKWTGMTAEINKRVPDATAIIGHPVELKNKIQRDLQPFTDHVAHAIKKIKVLDDPAVRDLIGTLLVASAEGRFTEPAVQAAAAKLASQTRDLFALDTGTNVVGAVKPALKSKPKAPPPTTPIEVINYLVPKSFGISIGWSAGAHEGIAAGFAGGFGFIADFDPNEKIYDIRAAISLGEEIGIGGKAAAYDLSVSALYNLYPVPAANSSGAGFGVVGGGGAFATVNAQIGWGFVGKKSVGPDDVPPGGIPVRNGYSVLEIKPSVGIGAGIQLDPGAAVLFHLGWTVTFGRPGTGGMCDASGCWDLGF